MHTILNTRLSNQQLLQKNFDKPEELIQWFGAVQAQDYLASLWAIALRLKHATLATLEEAIEQKKIVRSWPMRGTIHFMASEDAKWMLNLLAPRLDTKAALNYRKAGLTPDIFTQAGEILQKELKNGKTRSRAELYKALNAAGIKTDMQEGQQRGGHILGYWARHGLICIATRQDKQHTIALLDDWIPHSRELSGDNAIAELAKRYFQSHGPATLKDFIWWSGLTMAEVKRGLQLITDHIKKDIIDGIEYVSITNSQKSELNQKIILLPPFDEYTVAYADRTTIIDQKYLKESGYGIAPNIILNGRIVGTWKRIVKKDHIALQPYLFSNTDLPGLEEAVTHYEKFLGTPVKLLPTKT